MGRMLSGATRRGTQAQIRFLTPVPAVRAPAPVARVYAQVERDFGLLAPPISLHAAAPGPLAAAWLMLRESLVATGLVRRELKEAVAVAVSLANRCPYCVEVHSTALHGLVGTADAVALAGGRAGLASDPALHLTTTWAGLGVPAVPRPFPAPHMPELVGTAVTFQYLNRMSNVFLVESPIPPQVPAPVRRAVRRLAGALLRPSLRRVAEPGAALVLLPAAPVPDDLGWATGSPTVVEAFARAGAAVEAAGERSVPAPVRALVTAAVRDWDGAAPGPSGGWARAAVADLPAEDRPAGQLALLAALASYQVTPSVVQQVRHYRPDDRSLVELVSWASLVAARRAAAWL